MTHVPTAATATAAAGTDDSRGAAVVLDLSYALRTVLRTGRHYRSAIQLYMGFGMRHQAVELALNVDPIMARTLAQECIVLEERKRLWLMIAKHAAATSSSSSSSSNTMTTTEKDVVSYVVSVLRDCGPDVLFIEDVLPFLPDFAQIDQIKDEICEALTSYSSKIDSLIREMNECDVTCTKLRDDIAHIRNYHMSISTNTRCALTQKPILRFDNDGGSPSSEPFYVFPSGYVVLASALKNEVMPYLTTKQRQRVQEIEQQLQQLQNAYPNSMSGSVDRSPVVVPAVVGGGGRHSSSLSSFVAPAAAAASSAATTINTTTSTRYRLLLLELEGILAAECPLTGSIMVESIDREFVNYLDMDDPDCYDNNTTTASTNNHSNNASNNNRDLEVADDDGTNMYDLLHRHYYPENTTPDDSHPLLRHRTNHSNTIPTAGGSTIIMDPTTATTAAATGRNRTIVDRVDL